MRLLLYGFLPFETDSVPPSDLAELRSYADLTNKSLQTLLEDALRESGVLFTPDGKLSKNFAFDCSNFSQIAVNRVKH